MKREIRFKAKSLNAGEWVYGYYVCLRNNDGSIEHHIHEFSMELIAIDPETLCQFTGHKDTFGVDIYESDLVAVVAEPDWKQESNRYAEVIFGNDLQWQFRTKSIGDVVMNHGLPLTWTGFVSLMVHGNIHG